MAFDSKSFLSNVSHKPGVYQMHDMEGRLLYVGKAKNLKNRLTSYFSNTGLNAKTMALVTRIESIDVTITSSETEALLLENNLIKKNKPPYNILLKDDKSYPYIFLSNHEFPLLAYARGKKKKNGIYFGPFPSSGAVRESLSFLQKVFRLRNCDDSYFNNRSRPCLQHQIGRCTAPCVDLITKQQYEKDLTHAKMFLQGKNPSLIKELQNDMEVFASTMEFEQAGIARDQIQHLRKVQESQVIESGNSNVDVAAIVQEQNIWAVQVLSIRHGQMQGSRSYYPRFNMEETTEEALTAFVSQYYLVMGREIPEEIILSHKLNDLTVIQSALSEQKGKQVRLSCSVRSDRQRWLDMSLDNAKDAVRVKIRDKHHMVALYEDLTAVLALDEAPTRMECFDISHSSGEATVASCVVFNRDGPLKSDYRKFNIEGIEGGDDYAAMDQALSRRFKKVTEDKMPDLLLIDGGKGQVGIARKILADLNLTSKIKLLGVSKGAARKAGMEVLLYEGSEFTLDITSPALHLIQQIRDESHRFAITGHRARRAKARGRSVLEDIEGIGPKRRRELLRFFGDVGQIKSANVDEIAKVPGISRQLAQEIYDNLHG
ncbi:MAG: excinuclease ABC subunit C [Crocinitomicaceae bacterium]|jgi:excinuclease ABC subunit C